MIDPTLFRPPAPPPPPLTWRDRVGLVTLLCAGCAVSILVFCAIILGFAELSQLFARAVMS